MSLPDVTSCGKNYCILICPDKKKSDHKIVNISYPISLNTCFGCSKGPSHSDELIEYLHFMYLDGPLVYVLCLSLLRYLVCSLQPSDYLLGKG